MSARKITDPAALELIEADARALWEKMATHHPRKPTWPALTEAERDTIRDIAANPYRDEQSG